ncbi:MAG: formylglycine-generating enzyme family protein, partial [Candidatus Coatesbacteria bacterium]|nr:formylglycine-generating enzyme family protein [Candidatus Coatesbacteria bacterium]
YRLPTEAEWEYACRAGTTTRYYSGDSVEDLHRAGWTLHNGSDRTHIVAQKEPNAWGFYDMHGNVCEACWDYCDFDYYSRSPDTDPRGSESATDGRTIRGGSWWDDEPYCRCSYRKVCYLGCLCGKVGLRLVRSGAYSAGPRVTLSVDKSSYNLGDTIGLMLSGYNYGEGVNVDVFVGFIDSVGRTLMLTPDGWSETRTPFGEPILPVPLFADVYVPQGFAMGPVPFEWLDLPCHTPPIGVKDDYYFLAALSFAGTYDWIGEVSYVGFFLDTGPGNPINMLSIPAGSFIMGSPESEEGHQASESPQHEVSVSAFLMSETEITQRQWEDVMGYSTNFNRYSPDLPAEGFNWFDSLVFCNQLSIADGFTPCYTLENVQYINAYHIAAADVTCDFEADGFRLPTEAEWEYACRAGTTTRYHSGDSVADLDRVDWHAENSAPETHPVAQKEPNPWGLYDVHGNVGEFCWDYYDETYYGRSPAVDPTGAERGDRRARRGGAWFATPDLCRSAYRKACGLNCWCDASGIRVVRRAQPLR